MVSSVSEVSRMKNADLALLTRLVTLVVVNHDRPAFLLRTLEYYRDYQGPVLVLDSSAEASSGIAQTFPGVTYLHVPQLHTASPHAKVAANLEHVKTPYTVFAADDGFILQDAVAECAAFLEANPDYGVSQGYSLGYVSLGNQVNFYRYDRTGREDYSAQDSQARLMDLASEPWPLSAAHGVIRTELVKGWYEALPEATGPQWLALGLTYFLLGSAKARVLPIAYSVQDASEEHGVTRDSVSAALKNADSASRAERDAFAAFLATAIATDGATDGPAFVQKFFAALRNVLPGSAALTSDLLFESTLKTPLEDLTRRFQPTQFVELPFYNKAFFDELAHIEFLIQALPAGREQLQQLEGIWVRQDAALKVHATDSQETIVVRLWASLDLNPYNRNIVKPLAQKLAHLGESEESQGMFAWLERLEKVSAPDRHALLNTTPSGQLLNWLSARTPTAGQAQTIGRYVGQHAGGPQIGIMLLDLSDSAEKLQITLDSLVEGQFKSFKIVVLTTGVPPTATVAQNTLHFVKVTPHDYVEKLNVAARQAACDWLMLAEVGDQFTASGLTIASLELMGAPDCRAVSGDEIHRQGSGALVDVFRPGFNLDLLQSLPALMARHWLIRKDVFLEAGGYSADFGDALEFELILRLIERGGMSWLAHLDEPLLICDAPQLADNEQERLALTRHLTARGYNARVTQGLPGTYRVEYRHGVRPPVSLIIYSKDDLTSLQSSVNSILLRTRYTDYEVIIVDDRSESPKLLEWLDRQQHGDGRVRVIKNDQGLSPSALQNEACRQARGQYLVFLSATSEVVNPNWIDLMLNHALRPEVGVVGPKLVDRKARVVEAGLILGFDGGVSAAFAGSDTAAPGYMHRLAVEQNYSAVSGACLMVRKELFDAVGGLDEAEFGAAYSDVDLCLKIGQSGYLIVWTPQVQFISQAQRSDDPVALTALRTKWAGPFAHDLAYNKNLALTGEAFGLAAAASVDWSQLLG